MIRTVGEPKAAREKRLTNGRYQMRSREWRNIEVKAGEHKMINPAVISMPDADASRV